MLYIYSGAVPGLDSLLRDKFGPDSTLTAIPYAAHETWSSREAADYFNDAGIRARSLSSAYYRNPGRLARAMTGSDAVFLCGGNTYEFLQYARHIGLFALLRDFEARGGVIVAESAGSIILSPDIATAGIPGTDADVNTPGLTDLQAMGRLAFHVSPHFEPESMTAAMDLQELQQLADRSGREVVVIEDGEGLVVEGDMIIHTVGTPKVLTPGASELPYAVKALPGRAPGVDSRI